MFWNSAVLVVPIIAGQTLVAALAAYAFGKLNFRGRKRLFLVYLSDDAHAVSSHASAELYHGG